MTIDDEESIFNILIATDNHLGYKFDDPIMSKDSFDTFAEILNFAVESESDAIFLCGDLFHHKEPNMNIIYDAIEMFNKVIYAKTECKIEV